MVERLEPRRPPSHFHVSIQANGAGSKPTTSALALYQSPVPFSWYGPVTTQGCMGKRVVTVLVVQVVARITYCELNDFGLSSIIKSPGLSPFSVAPPAPPLPLPVPPPEPLVPPPGPLGVVIPSFRSRIFSSHSSQPWRARFRLRCW